MAKQGDQNRDVFKERVVKAYQAIAARCTKKDTWIMQVTVVGNNEPIHKWKRLSKIEGSGWLKAPGTD